MYGYDTGEAKLRNTFWLVSQDQDKVNTSKVLRDIWTLIGYMTYTSRNTAPDVYQKAVWKGRIDTSPFHGV